MLDMEYWLIDHLIILASPQCALVETSQVHGVHEGVCHTYEGYQRASLLRLSGIGTFVLATCSASM